MKCTSALIGLVALVTPCLTQINLGTAASFGALAVTGITNTGLTIVDGDIGTSGASITGFPPGVFTGTTGTGSPAAVQGRADATSAFDAALALSGGIMTNPTLGGQTLLAGVYAFNTSVTLAGNLTLDGAGDSNATWVFQIPGANTITTAALSAIILVNGASGCNVFWAIGTSATLGAESAFAGNILANVSISVTTGAVIDGGLYAGAAITLQDNAINATDCGPILVLPSNSSSSSTASASSSSTSTNLSTTTTPVVPTTVSSTSCLASTATITDTVIAKGATVTDTVTAKGATITATVTKATTATVTKTDTVKATTTIFKNCRGGVSVLGICLL